MSNYHPGDPEGKVYPPELVDQENKIRRLLWEKFQEKYCSLQPEEELWQSFLRWCEHKPEKYMERMSEDGIKEWL